MNIKNKIIEKYKYWNLILVRRRNAQKVSKGHQVKFYNWCKVWDQDFWLVDFIEKRGLLKDKPNATIALYSIFAPDWLTHLDKADARIFVARENVHKKGMQHWSHQFINDKRFQLSLGFDNIDHNEYLRHPLWLMWDVFEPTDNYEDIKRKVAYMNSPANKSFDERRFCSFLCSHDDIGRKRIYGQLSEIDKVDCDGKLFHNNDTLITKFKDNKLEYLKDYRFNLTPENTDYPGYCTEKLVEAISAGCIPIYNGCKNNPEPDIFNHNAIIFIKMDEENKDAVSLVKELNSDKKRYMDFASQPRFIDGAVERIWEYYETLENKLKEIIKNV